MGRVHIILAAVIALVALLGLGDVAFAGTFEITSVSDDTTPHSGYLGVEIRASASYMGTLDPGDHDYLIQTFLNHNKDGDALNNWGDPDRAGDGLAGNEIHSGMSITCKGACAAYANLYRKTCPETYNYKGKGGVTIYHQFSPEIDIDYSSVGLVDCANDTPDDAYDPGDPLEDPLDGGGSDGCSPNCTPIVINLGHGTIRLSGLDDPVEFDMNGDGFLETLSWTARGSDTAFLAYDRDWDGLITKGYELFGNFTPQHDPEGAPNGFKALATFDLDWLGGNEDGWMSAEDRYFGELRLWFDDNHDGVSQEHELFPLSDYGIEAIEVDPAEHRWRDRHGNEFRYSSRVRFEGGRTTRAVDVFLLSGSP